MKRFIPLVAGLAGLMLFACDSGTTDPPADPTTASSGSGAGEPAIDPAGNDDGDCMTNGEELALGTDHTLADSDADGIGDCEEIACVSDPLDALEQCYACGWKHNDPGNLVSNGAALGNVMADVLLSDACGEEVSSWDFAGDYQLYYLLPAW